MSGLPQQARVHVPRPVLLQPEDLPVGGRTLAARGRAEEDVQVVAKDGHHGTVGVPRDGGDSAVWSGEMDLEMVMGNNVGPVCRRVLM